MLVVLTMKVLFTVSVMIAFPGSVMIAFPGSVMIAFPLSQYFMFLTLDINECLNNPCHEYANCTDSQGSFDCDCYDGFSGDGFSNCTSKAMVSLIMLLNNQLTLTLVPMVCTYF